MSTNEAAERLPHEALAVALEREFSGHSRPVTEADWTNYGSRVELALWGLGYRVERSAGASPMDVERLAEVLCLTLHPSYPHSYDGACGQSTTRAIYIAAEYARLSEGSAVSEGTDR